MPRVRAVTMDGLTVHISPLSYNEADEFLRQGKELASHEPTVEDWAKRTLSTVCLTLNKARKAQGQNGNGEEWTVQKLTDEFDMVFINKIFSDFIEMSGLNPVKPGEPAAASTSRSPDAASSQSSDSAPTS